MVDIIVTCDEKDAELGSFFSSCKEKTKVIFLKNTTISEFDSAKLQNDIPLSIKLSSMVFPFVLLTFTHGTDDSLIVDGGMPYISLQANIDRLMASFLYSFSCKVGRTLGKSATEKYGCRCFVGHAETIWAYHYSSQKLQSLFSKPIEIFLSAFRDEETVNNAVASAKDEYTKEIDAVYVADYLFASFLLQNRDSTVIYGDTKCTIKDFEHG
jgi:hypothetical protein